MLDGAPRSPESPVIDGKTPADYKHPLAAGILAAVGFCDPPIKQVSISVHGQHLLRQKAARKIARRTEINKARRSRMRSTLRAVDEAIASGDRNKALEAMKNAEPALMRAARQGQVHRNTASRKVSRLTHQIAKLGK